MSGHGCTFEGAMRDDSGRAEVMVAKCACGEAWVAPSYEEAEDGWRQHVHALTGEAPRPMCGQQGRWTP